MKKIIVIGGGITGLASAYYTKTFIEQKNLPFEVQLLEASSQLGGKISTLNQNGFTIERGADSFLARKQAGMDLIHALQLEDQLHYNQTGQSYVLSENKLFPIPAGSFMGIPVQETPLMESELLTEEGKQRAINEITIPKGPALKDQSLGSFLRNRFGDELVDKLLAPLLSGIYSSDVDQMSLMSSFPNLYALEQKYGSVLAGLRKTLPDTKANTGKKSGQFASLKGGLGTLVEKLQTELKECIQFQTEIKHIEPLDHGYRLFDQNKNSYEAAGIILALPHRLIPGLFQSSPVFDPLLDIPVSSVANAVLTFNENDIKQAMAGTGFVVARNSDVRITACTWTHKKWPDTTPEGKALLRCYAGKPSDQKIVSYDDDTIVNLVLKDLEKTMGITAQPESSIVTRWKEQMPQYTVGHRERVEKVKQEVKKAHPGLLLAGASYDGVGIPDCIADGKTAAESVLEYAK